MKCTSWVTASSGGHQPGNVPSGAVADSATAMEGRQESSTLGLAWPALLARAQANRDTASALLQAMRAQCDPCAYTLHSDERHCWYNDAQDVVNIAHRASNVAEPNGNCRPSAMVSDIDTPPATPRNRRSVAAAAGDEALDTLPKRGPPSSQATCPDRLSQMSVEMCCTLAMSAETPASRLTPTS